MKANYTHILYILDRSGSMSIVQNDVIGGFNNFIKEQKEQVGDCTFSLVQFDNFYESVYDFIPMKQVAALDFSPRGSTSLYDAMGRAIVETGEKLALIPEFARPEKVMVIVQTDGEENSSKDWNKKRVAELIKQQEEKYSWKFIFLGTNFDVMGESDSLNILKGNTMSYKNNSDGIAVMYNAVSRGVSNLRSCSMNSYTQDCCFNDTETVAELPTK